MWVYDLTGLTKLINLSLASKVYIAAAARGYDYEFLVAAVIPVYNDDQKYVVGLGTLRECENIAGRIAAGLETGERLLDLRDAPMTPKGWLRK